MNNLFYLFLFLLSDRTLTSRKHFKCNESLKPWGCVTDDVLLNGFLKKKRSIKPYLLSWWQSPFGYSRNQIYYHNTFSNLTPLNLMQAIWIKFMDFAFWFAWVKWAKIFLSSFFHSPRCPPSSSASRMLLVWITIVEIFLISEAVTF